MAAVEFFCGCVNVGVVFESGKIRNSNSNEFISNSSNEYMQFFRDARVLENAEGLKMTVKLDFLCDKRITSDWIIHKCVNCGIFTYATSMKAPLICLLSKQMLPSSEVNALKTSPNYSPVYEVVLPFFVLGNDINDNNGSKASSLSQYHLKELENLTSKRLKAENDLMEERVREFENKQLLQFSRFKSRVNHDKDILRQVIVSFFDNFRNRTNETEEESPMINDELSKISLPKTYKLQPVAQLPANRFKKRNSPVVAQDTIFSMDEDNVEEFDDIEVGNGNDDHNEDSGILEFDSLSDGDPFPPFDRIYATSLPIDMPKRMRSPINHVVDLDDVEDDVLEKVDDPQWMAASIQALAMSVRACDGTEMFGARPRPRLNTMD
ncbi:hypothetical protein CHUAL_000535 [Chamberlinius hualienensis]